MSDKQFILLILQILIDEWKNMPKAEAKARPAGDHSSAFYASTITASLMQNDGKGILKPIQESAYYG
jgi:hypothetical protein